VTFTSRRNLDRTHYQKSSHFGDAPNETNGWVFSVSGCGPSGVKRPQWRSDVANHQNAGNPGSSRYVVVKGGTDGHGDLRYTIKDLITDYPVEESIYGWMGSLSDSMAGPNAASPAYFNRAMGSWCKKAAAKISPFAGGTFLGELRESIHMIRHPAESLFNELLRHKRRVKRRVDGTRDSKSKRRIVADSWLESVFGWLPLISDVRSGAEALARVVGGFIPNEIVQVTVPDDPAVISYARRVLQSMNNLQWRYDSLVRDQGSLRIKGAVRMSPAVGLKGNLEVFGLSWENVIPTVWELIPFSFVTDYFTNVGDILTSASLVDSRVVWCTATSRREREYAYDGFRYAPAGLTNEQGSVDAGRMTVTWIELTRSIPASVVPSLTFTCPGVGSMKWLNLAALFTPSHTI
jgi:hypothetical protein